MKVTVYHNPGCGTSRNVLALLAKQGIEPEVIEYLKAPPSLEQWKALIKHSGLAVRDFLRTKEKFYVERDLASAKWTDEQLLEMLAENPILLNRPVVATAKGVKLCRPAEMVLDLL